MNAQACAYLEFILRDPSAWETIRENRMVIDYKPKISHIQHEMMDAREAQFYDQVYFPHLQRLMNIVKRWDLFKGATWELRELGYFTEIMCWIPNEEEWQDIIGNHMQYYMEPIWDNEQWAWENFHVSEEDVRSLGIRPSNMEAVQAVLFGNDMLDTQR